MLSDENVERYAKGLYPIAILLILVPLTDLSLRVFPPQFGLVQWRFATVGLLLGNSGTILLGAGLLGLVAALAGHRGVLRGLGYATLIVAVIMLATLVLFSLDALQIRRLANPNIRRAVTLSSGGALFTGVLVAVALVALGRGALAAARPTRVAARRVTAAPSPLVVANQGAGDSA